MMERVNFGARSGDAGDAWEQGVGTNDRDRRGGLAAVVLARRRGGPLRGAGALPGPDAAPREAGAGRVSELLVGLDIGTSAVKGIAIGPDGRVAAIEQAAYPLSTPRPGWS